MRREPKKIMIVLWELALVAVWMVVAVLTITAH
jgi:hypothetical protein